MDLEITEFGRRLGLENLTLSPEVPLTLEISELGRLHLEMGEGELLVYISAHLPAYDQETLLRALARTGFEAAPPFPLSCGLTGDRMLLMTRLAPARVTAAELERTAEYLMRQLREVLAGV